MGSFFVLTCASGEPTLMFRCFPGTDDRSAVVNEPGCKDFKRDGGEQQMSPENRNKNTCVIVSIRDIRPGPSVPFARVPSGI
jgi:hypothetical protein